MSRRPTEPLLKLSLAMVGITLAFAAGELLLALAGIAEPEPRAYPGERENQYRDHFVTDPEVGWRMRPDVNFRWTIAGVEANYFADSDGFRAPAPVQSRAARTVIPDSTSLSKVEIALIGDSFIWGFGVPYEATCGALLEKKIPGARILNRAMPGFALDQVWLSLRHWALPGEPNLVIVGLFLDDFNRSFHAYRQAEGFNKPTFRLADEQLVKLGVADRPGWLYRFFERRSRLFALGRRADRKLGRLQGTGRWWSLNAAFLDAIRRDAADAGIPIFFVHIPYVEQVPFPALDAYMERHDASYLGLPPWTPIQQRELFFEGDVHLDADGHRFLAEALTQHITELTSIREGSS